MKRSNMIVASIALVMTMAVVICITAFKERDKSSNKAGANNGTVAQEDNRRKKTAALSLRCAQVETLVLDAPENYYGHLGLINNPDSGFWRADAAKVRLDTLLSADGKTLTVRLVPLVESGSPYTVYFELYIALPALKSITSTNVDIAIIRPYSNLGIVMRGESMCYLPVNENGSSFHAELYSLSKLYCPSMLYWGGSTVKAAGNAIVELKLNLIGAQVENHNIGMLMLEKKQITLQDNAIVER
jgi:hypothetical protein